MVQIQALDMVQARIPVMVVVILVAMVVILVAMADRYLMGLRRSRLRLRRHLPSKLLPGADLRVA